MAGRAPTGGRSGKEANDDENVRATPPAQVRTARGPFAPRQRGHPSLRGGVLTVIGTDRADTIVVRQTPPRASPSPQRSRNVRQRRRSGRRRPGRQRPASTSTPPRHGRQRGRCPRAVTGGAGNDLIVGGGGDDTLFGGAGEQQSPAAPATIDRGRRGGRPALRQRRRRHPSYGGDGDDVGLGGDGDDFLDGAAGDDCSTATTATTRSIGRRATTSSTAQAGNDYLDARNRQRLAIGRGSATTPSTAASSRRPHRRRPRQRHVRRRGRLRRLQKRFRDVDMAGEGRRRRRPTQGQRAPACCCRRWRR